MTDYGIEGAVIPPEVWVAAIGPDPVSVVITRKVGSDWTILERREVAPETVERFLPEPTDRPSTYRLRSSGDVVVTQVHHLEGRSSGTVVPAGARDPGGYSFTPATELDVLSPPESALAPSEVTAISWSDQRVTVDLPDGASPVFDLAAGDAIRLTSDVGPLTGTRIFTDGAWWRTDLTVFVHQDAVELGGAVDAVEEIIGPAEAAGHYRTLTPPGPTTWRAHADYETALIVDGIAADDMATGETREWHTDSSRALSVDGDFGRPWLWWITEDTPSMAAVPGGGAGNGECRSFGGDVIAVPDGYSGVAGLTTRTRESLRWDGQPLIGEWIDLNGASGIRVDLGPGLHRIDYGDIGTYWAILSDGEGSIGLASLPSCLLVDDF